MGPTATPLGVQLEDAASDSRFDALQARLPRMFERIFPDPLEPRVVLVVPSLSMDPAALAKVKGVHHYEERMLCMLMLLRLPRTRVIFTTSQPIAPAIVDYYLNLLPGVPAIHARERLHLLACHDGSDEPLTRKLLARPRLLERIRSQLGDPERAHMSCFTVTNLERDLALELDVPIYGCDPRLAGLGTKSGSRKVFREAGNLLADGEEDLRDPHHVVAALAALKRRNPGLQRAVVKHDEGFSGEGNAILPLAAAPCDAGLETWLHRELPRRIRFTARGETWDRYAAKLAELGGIVETFIEGSHKQSPSVQYRVDPLGRLEEISTHDQVLGGAGRQVFLGCTFPARRAYRQSLQQAGRRAAEILCDRGVRGRFAIDFITVPSAEGFVHYAVEINLRKGGTTHPFMALQFLTDGRYDPESGLYRTAAGQTRAYFASDNLEDPRYIGLTPRDLIDIAVARDLHFHSASQQGVVFHLIGALSEFGKLGVMCVAPSVKGSRKLYDDTVSILGAEAARR